MPIGRPHGDVGSLGHGHDEIEVLQTVTEPRVRLDVGEHGGPPLAAHQIDGVGQIGPGPEVGVEPSQLESQLARAGIEIHLLRSRLQGLIDHGLRNLDEIPVTDRATGSLQQLRGRREQHPHPGVRQDGERGLMNLIELRIGEHPNTQ